MAQLFANAARSTLTASITAGSTQLQINPADQALFPVATGADWFKVALEDSSGNLEFMQVQRAVGQSLLTISARAAEDATKFPARAFVAGSLVELRMTAADLASSIAHPGVASGAHAASAISVTPAGAIAATNVQAALQELDGEKADAAATASALSGKVSLTGAETIAGVKTFSSSPVVPAATSSGQAVPKQQLDAATRADLSALSVTVAANAMTCALPAEVLSFRSTTPNDGAVFARTYAGGSLTVPSGATLGTTNGAPARLVWGLIDNAGTPEPFVINVAGTANLDETTLINTTAISGSANSANTFYAQANRSSVAFRIRGWCDITQVTAGTWATAPSKVTGASAQTLKPIQGRGRVPQNVLASRAFGVTYTNTTGYEIFVHVNIQWTSGVGAARLTVDGVNYDGPVFSGVNQTSQVNVPVPPDGTYTFNGTNSIGFTFLGWNESRVTL